MNVYKTHEDATALVAKRLEYDFWASRASDMIKHVCLRRSKDGSTPIADHRVKVDRVASGWPRNGSITLTRDDGQRFRLYMTQNSFKIGRL
jgi:hypothetical protein